jgi:hypothetical protein
MIHSLINSLLPTRLQLTYTPFDGPIAQRLEQATHNRLVTGSNPVGPTIPNSFITNALVFFSFSTLPYAQFPLGHFCSASWVLNAEKRIRLELGLGLHQSRFLLQPEG